MTKRKIKYFCRGCCCFIGELTSDKPGPDVDRTGLCDDCQEVEYY